LTTSTVLNLVVCIASLPAMPNARLEDVAELNGAPVSPEAMHALGLVNYGHFTSMRVDEQRIRGLSQHLDRLVRDCHVLFGAVLDRERVQQFVRKAIGGRQGSFVVRVTIFDSAADLGHPGTPAEPSVLVSTRSAGTWPPTPLRVQAVAYLRALPQVKHVGLFGALWHRKTAQATGFDDALFVDGSAFVEEGPTWNVGFFDGERVLWPSGEILPGVTMTLLKQVHEQTITAPVSLEDVGAMQAAFAANASIGVRAIGAINDITLSDDHPVFETLRKEYEAIPSERP
jgi:branched-subunit amino acid aminotransferase/4-amino-4-deoxychorismate lyase